MTENETAGFSSEPSETEITNLNLGIKRPLPTHKPLGQKLISPKFSTPIGAKKLSNSEPQIQDSPVLSEFKSNKPIKSTSTSTNIQQKSDNNNFTLQPSQTEAIAPTNVDSTIIQAKAEQNFPEKTEIPQLPQALKNISNYRPISQSSIADKIDSPPTHHIQKAPVQDIPDSWSSIAELFGKTQVESVSQTTVVQALKDKQHWDNQLTPLQNIKTLKNKTSEQFIQAKPDTSNSAESIDDNYSNLSTNKDSAPKEELENLDTLAREVYKMLKQRLDIERERRGNNYSGRLPW